MAKYSGKFWKMDIPKKPKGFKLFKIGKPKKIPKSHALYLAKINYPFADKKTIQKVAKQFMKEKR